MIEIYVGWLVGTFIMTSTTTTNTTNVSSICTKVALDTWFAGLLDYERLRS